MKQIIVLITGFIIAITMYLFGMHSIANGAELNWYRQPAYPSVFDRLLTQDETNNYILVNDYIQNHPDFSYCMYRIRLFKRKSSNYEFEDVILMYFYHKPTTNSWNRYVLVEAKWTYDSSLTRNFWNDLTNKVFREIVLPKYFSKTYMSRNEFLVEYNKPYSIYIKGVASNSLW